MCTSSMKVITKPEKSAQKEHKQKGVGNGAPASNGRSRERGLLGRWLKGDKISLGKHDLTVLAESRDSRDNVSSELRKTVRDHYMSPEMWSERLEDLGAPETAKILKELLPKLSASRSGDTGEILATEVAEQELGYTVPVRRLRWKDGRNAALRGDDIVGVAQDSNGTLQFLKGESKSRARLQTSVINEAAQALDAHMGRPSRHSVLFVANRLRELGEKELATELEVATIESFQGYDVEHLLFVICGNDPSNFLADHLKRVIKKSRRRHAIGIQIEDHTDFIRDLFDSF